jgi:hypothetical protein
MGLILFFKVRIEPFTAREENRAPEDEEGIARSMINFPYPVGDVIIVKVVSYFTGVNLVLNEGYKRGDKPKIHRKEVLPELLCGQGENFVVVEKNSHFYIDYAQFGWVDIEALADFIIEQCRKFYPK